MYRDDLRMQAGPRALPTDIPADGLDGTVVVLVDDVLFSGRTIRAALDALNDIGRPPPSGSPCSSTAATASCPIRADFVGKNLPDVARRGGTVAGRRSDGDGRRHHRGRVPGETQ